MRLKKLEDLHVEGVIKHFKLESVDDEGNVGQKTGKGDTERLTIEFPTGEILVISTWCSGCSENSGFEFS